MDTHHLQSQRASAALQNLFVADALAMPVHWFYSIRDIEKAFPYTQPAVADAGLYRQAHVIQRLSARLF
jgi:hypothetical protein